MARNTAMPSGYDYDFVENLPQDYICVICQNAMKNPVQTRCGHLFCRECLDEAYERKPNECPSDRRRLAPQDIFPDKSTERKILSLKIKCPHQGCDWQGELRDIEGHTSQCQKCHFNCPNECGKTMKREEEVLSHLTDECPLTIVPCSYQNIGCSFEVQRKYLNDHIDNHVKQHLDIAVEKTVSLQKQLNANERNLKQMDEMCKRFQIQMDEMKKQNTLTNQRNQKQMAMGGMCKQVPPTIQDILKRIPPNSPIMTKDDKGYSYVWKITDYFSQWNAQKPQYGSLRLTSDPFKTHVGGYTLQLEIQLENKHDEQKKQYTKVSIRLNIIQGEYDGDLTWPFPWNAIRFTLLDGNRHVERRANIDSHLRCHGYPATVKASCSFENDKLVCRDRIVDNTVFLKLEILH